MLQRAHYLPLFSRAGPYDTTLLDRAAHYAPRRLFEYWGHEASLLPVALQPLLRWRMARAADDAWGSMRRIERERPELVAEVLEEVRARGPVAASEVLAHERPARSGPWWGWSDVKRAFEWLFWSGQLTSARRRTFERLYDLPERVLPAEVLRTPTPPVEDAQRELVRIAARSLGVAAERDLRDYFRLPAADAKARVAELAEAGELLGVEVEGWRAPAYVAPGARVPRAVDAAALVGPFDSLIWERNRTERLFGFRYRIEIYVPAPDRVHGYYVLPFLLGDRLVARVDLKADRQAGALLVQAAHAEPDAPRAHRGRAALGARVDGGLAGARARARHAARRPRGAAGGDATLSACTRHPARPSRSSAPAAARSPSRSSAAAHGAARATGGGCGRRCSPSRSCRRCSSWGRWRRCSRTPATSSTGGSTAR